MNKLFEKRYDQMASHFGRFGISEALNMMIESVVELYFQLLLAAH